MNLDEVGYGNPTLDNTKAINQTSFLDELFGELTAFTYPQNTSESTKDELNQIVKNIDSLKRDAEKQNRYATYDVYLDEFYAKFLSQYNIPSEEVLQKIEQLHDDIKPLITKLKYYFQRPRPYQLAYYYKLKLMPFTTLGSDSPSFPSGHAVQSKVYSEVLGNHYPELYAKLMQIHQDICDSRMMLGVHFQSDIDVGIYVGERILQTKEFMIKYQL